jgi:hypothetical protein
MKGRLEMNEQPVDNRINPNDIGTIDIKLSTQDLDILQEEYESLALAIITDDIDCSMSTWLSRDNRLDEIEELVGKETVANWRKNAECKAYEHGYASGKPYKESRSGVEFPINNTYIINNEKQEMSMSKFIMYVGEGGDMFANEVIEEIMEFANGSPVTIKPLQDYSPGEIDDYEQYEDCVEMYVVISKD